MKTSRRLLIFAFMLAFALPASAAMPTAINFQGRLTNAAGAPLSGDRPMSIKIYDAASGGTLLYSETIGTVAVDENGVYGFQFGTNGTGAPAGLASSLAVSNGHWLELLIDGTAQSPRQKLLAVPFALLAKGLPDGAVTAPMIANGAVGITALSPGVIAALSGGTATPWGSISGSISDQPDLALALSEKVAKSATINGVPLSGNIAITKSDVGLGNVDNTSDANKPVSTLTSTALGLKVDLATLTTMGAPNKIPKTDVKGNINLSTITPTGVMATFTNSLFMGYGGGQRIQFLNPDGGDGAGLLYNFYHSGQAELQINGARIALCDEYHGALQFGLQRGWDSKQHVYFQARGTSDPIHTAVDSRPVFLTATYWNGSASVSTRHTGFQGKVVTGGAADTYTSFFADATVPDERGGDGSRTEVMGMYKSGLRLTVQDTTHSDAAVSRAYGDDRWKVQFSKLSSDQTYKNTATPADTGMSVTLAAGTSYRIEMVAAYSAAKAANGLQHKLSYSGNMQSVGGEVTIAKTPTTVNMAAISGTSGPDGYHNPILLYHTVPSIHSVVIYTTTTGGILNVQASQAVAGADQTVLKAGAWILATPLP